MKLERFYGILIPILSIILGIAVGAIVMIAGGYDAGEGFYQLYYGIFGEPYSIGETLRATAPLIFAGLAVAFAFRTGLFNIGVEGQVLVGWMVAVWIGISFDLPTAIHLPLALIGAGLAGALWAAVPGVLKAVFHVHEVITSIMMNYIALYLTNDILRRYIGITNERTETVKESASLASTFLSELTDFSRLHNGIFVAVLAAAVFWFILWKTTLGYELRAVGFNKSAAEYAGMSVKRNIVLSFVISGVFAGLAGAMEGLGTFQNMTLNASFTGVGFDGIAVALLGANNPIGVVLAALLFAGLNIGGLSMQQVGIPPELIKIIIAFIIIFVASGYAIRLVIDRFTTKKDMAKTSKGAGK
ncbi:ABC transporter permease [Exiguobacterium flavidum]|uniref:ABC transporter permease n=1 Tax=Exiguobacterium flavidum TaxID=2184695 RepID=UPI000DF7AF24|nr:ABC transporter permease [Exiguobacterium flavidum]